MRSILRKMGEICRQWGVPLASNKTEGLSQTLTFLGIQVHSVNQTLSLRAAKLSEIIHLRSTCRRQKSFTVTDLESDRLVQFATRYIPAGRLFACRMLSLIPENRSFYIQEKKSRVDLDKMF